MYVYSHGQMPIFKICHQEKCILTRKTHANYWSLESRFDSYFVHTKSNVHRFIAIFKTTCRNLDFIRVSSTIAPLSQISDYLKELEKYEAPSEDRTHDPWFTRPVL